MNRKQESYRNIEMRLSELKEGYRKLESSSYPGYMYELEDAGSNRHFAVDLRICSMLSGSLAESLRIVFLVFLFVDICLISYAFPLTAYFSNSVWGTLKSAFWMSLGHLPFTISVLVFEAIPPVFCYWFPHLAWRLIIPVMVLIGFSGTGWACVQVFRFVFRQHEPERKDSGNA